MSERRDRALLVSLLLGQFVLLTLQAPGPSSETSWAAGVTMRLVAPFARAVERSEAAVAGLREALATRRRLLRDNRRMRVELETLERQLVGLQSADTEVQHLSAAVGYARQIQVPLLVADVVYCDHTSWLRSLVLHATPERLEVDQPVVTGEGVVGRVIGVAGPYAKVQLITDRAAAVGAMVARTRRQGVVRGRGESALSLDFLSQRADVQPGDRVLTAGNDGIYPRELMIGTVTSVEPRDGLFLRIELTPAVDFGLLEQVFVLGSRAVPEAVVRSESDERL